ncbi:10767_t:CDS:1 [Acaulospora morrowiae]|uniref:Post-GPI attachment to proteins factor 3 n=1 Tax=Acaulospora morrowiae TaxID=94023 RepID=A0A9N9C832_9GLOM|nr:10767_t:CDS:1 [Acaulospora morrowiae]
MVQSKHPTGIAPFLFACFLLLTFFPAALASAGDLDQEFQKCVADSSAKCSLNPTLPLILRIFAWSCEDNCRYKCMHQITDQAVSLNKEIAQYYGKWPFHRLWGIQEPASVLFSILNGYMHYRYLPKLHRQIQDFYYMKKFYIIYAYIGINSWIWSSVYHSRDFPTTEELDYFSAGLSILYNLFCTVLRVFQVRNTKYTTIWALICLLAFSAHVSYLHFFKFDYEYNIVANIGVGLLNNLIWVGWSLTHWHRRPDDYWKPLVVVALIIITASLEVFDFPPWWRIFDAHSLWHASTIYIIAFWYEFILEDARIESFRESKGKKIDK